MEPVEAAASSHPAEANPGPAEQMFQDLVAESGRAYRLAVRTLCGADGAEDVVQQACLKLLVQFRRGATPAEPRTWFLKLVANEARDLRRRRASLKRREAAVQQDRSPGPDLEAELVEHLRAAMNALEEKYRLPVALCCEEGLTQQQAAEVLEMPASTISKHVNIGLEQLRKALVRAGYTAAPAMVIGALAHTAPPVPATLAAALTKLVVSGAAVKGTGAAAASAALKGGLAVKIGLCVAAAGLVAGTTLWAVGGKSGEPPKPLAAAPAPAPAPPPPAQQSYPMIIPDESAGDWVVDRFAGSSSAGPEFFQGPARQVGGLGRPGSVAPAPDGTVYIATDAGVVEVAADGTLRLVIGGGGGLAWNPKEKMLYLTGPNCIRRLVVKPDGSRVVEIVAGTPHKAGLDDGPAKTATFTTAGNFCINSRGAIYFLDGQRYGECIRKLENGEVTTITRSGRGGGLVDGPLAQAKFNLIGLGGGIALGEEDDVLYMADHWNYAVRRIDVKNGQVTTVAGMPDPKVWPREKRNEIEKRFNGNADGPALTWAAFNSGCANCCFDPVHKALWCGGPDESRFRWLKDFYGKEGMVKTVIGAKGNRDRWNKDGLGVPAEGVGLVWNAVCAVDAQGRAYLAASSDPNGVWRAYNQKEVKP